MRLETEVLDQWPPLAWLAICSRGQRSVRVLHGPRVEIGDGFVCEAVWPGEFSAGELDRAAVVAGSGVRIRGDEAVFVSSASTVDRLHSVERSDGSLVSNSLPCLMSAIGARARLDYWRYLPDMGSIVLGLDRYRRTIPTTAEPVRLTYFHNLTWDGTRLAEREKPVDPTPLRNFHDYRRFLESALEGVAANMSSEHRASLYRWLGTLSSGYDSAAATTLGARVGCREAISFDRSRRGEPDSGEAIARALGIEPLLVERASWRRRALRFDPMPEVPFLASVPTGELTPFAAVRGHLEGRVLLTGFQGGAEWKLRTEDPTPAVVRKDFSGIGFTEYRLIAGFINCPPAFWTARAAPALARIGRSEEMRPWVIGDRYQRPIARRIVEDAGVPREAFGQRLQPGVGGALAKEAEFLTPLSLADYRAWLRRNAAAMDGRWLLRTAALDVSARAAVPVARLAVSATRSAEAAVGRPIATVARRRTEKLQTALVGFETRPLPVFAFQWAIDRAIGRYPLPEREPEPAVPLVTSAR